MISAPLARIIARYVSMLLVSFGLMGEDLAAQISTDPDVIALLSIAIGGAIAAVTEYSYARRPR